MVVDWTFTVIHTDIETDVSTDITEFVVSIPNFTDTGTGEANTALLKLDAEDGRFLVTAPIIDQFDRIRISGNDEKGYAYNKVFDVKSPTLPENKTGGTIIEVILVGLEQHLQRMYFVGPREFTNAFEMFKLIGKYYNENRGTKQPLLIGHDDITHNKLPNYTINTYDYGLNQEKCYNRMMQVIDKLGGSVESGGVLDYFDLKFISSTGTVNEMTAKVFSSGEPGSFIIRSESSDDVITTVGAFDDIEGNNVFAWGGDTDGSFPVDYSQYKSKQQIFPLHPIWRSDVPYKIGARVQRLGIHYKRGPPDVTLPPPGNPTTDLDWDEISEADEFGDVVDYSPWTRNKAFEWESSFANQEGAENSFLGRAAWDGNTIIFDEDTAQRTWVNCVISNGGSTSDIPTNLLYGGGFIYRGFRVLLLNTGIGAFAGDDNFGNSKNKQVLEFGDIGDPLGAQGWFVKFPDLLIDPVTQLPTPNAMVAVIDEGTASHPAGRVYQYDGTGWNNDLSSEQNGNDCFHPYVSIDNVSGIPDNEFGLTPTDKNYRSAISIKYIYNPGGMGVVDGVVVLADLDNKDYYGCGGWLNLRLPYPIRSIFGISEDIGYLFGSQDISNFNTEPATLDSENMNYLPDGTRGFNQVMSESYGNLSDLAFFMEILYQYTRPISGTLYTSTEANFKVRCFLFDTNDNVVFQDFIIAFNNKWEEFHLPLSGFGIYRGRRPKILTDLFIPVKQQDAQNIFRWRNIKQICFQLQESYDSDGRFEPHLGRYVSNPNVTDTAELTPAFFLLPSDRHITLSIDAFRFTKPLLVGSGVVTVRDMEVDFLERPTIGNYYQLQGDVLAELEKSQHRKTIFEIHTPGEYTITHGDTFYYINPRLVNFTDSGANTVKLVAKKIEYSITKPKDGAGGFLRKITGVRRFPVI